MLAIVNLCVIWTKMLFEQQIPDGQGVQNVKGLYRLQSYYFPGKFYQVYPSIQLAKKECVSMFWPMANAGRKISKWLTVKKCYSRFHFYVLDYCQWLCMPDELSIPRMPRNRIITSTSGNFRPYQIQTANIHFKVSWWWLVQFLTFDCGLKEFWGRYLLLPIHFVTKISNMAVV